LEHHPSESELQLIHLTNYSLGANYCRKTFLKGGVSIFVYRNLNYSTINIDEYNIDKDTEACAVDEYNIDKDTEACAVDEYNIDKDIEACAVDECNKDKNTEACAVDEYNIDKGTEACAVDEYNIDKDTETCVVDEYNIDKDTEACAVDEYKIDKDTEACAVDEYKIDKDNEACAVDEYNIDKDAEVCAIQLDSTFDKLCILIIYRFPRSDFTNFLKRLDLFLQKLYNNKYNIVVCGDINVNYLIYNNRRSQLDAVLHSYNPMGRVEFPTRFGLNSQTAIGNVFIDIFTNRKYDLYPLINGLPDHDAQLLILNMGQKKKNECHTYTKRKINKYTTADFQLKLSHENGNRFLMKMMLIRVLILF
jgi:hypothetical protein